MILLHFSFLSNLFFSINTGTMISLSGKGFSRNNEENHVELCGVSCDVVHSNETTIMCRTGTTLFDTKKESSTTAALIAKNDDGDTIVREYEIINTISDMEGNDHSNWTTANSLNIGNNWIKLYFYNVHWNKNQLKLDNAELILHSKEHDHLRLKIQIDVTSRSDDNNGQLLSNTTYWEPTAWSIIGESYRVDVTNHLNELMKHSNWSTTSNTILIKLKRVEGDGQRRAVSFDTYSGYMSPILRLESTTSSSSLITQYTEPHHLQTKSCVVDLSIKHQNAFLSSSNKSMKRILEGNVTKSWLISTLSESSCINKKKHGIFKNFRIISKSSAPSISTFSLNGQDIVFPEKKSKGGYQFVVLDSSTLNIKFMKQFDTHYVGESAKDKMVSFISSIDTNDIVGISVNLVQAIKPSISCCSIYIEFICIGLGIKCAATWLCFLLLSFSVKFCFCF